MPAHLEGTRILLPPGSTDWLQFVHTLPEVRSDRTTGFLSCRYSPAAAWRIYKVLGPDRIDATILERARRFDAALKESQRLLHDPCAPPPPLTKMKSRQYQCQGYGYMMAMEAALCGDEMGLGKTKTVIDVLVNADCRKILILCPNSVKGVWRRELARHAGHPIEACILDGNGKATQPSVAAKKTISEKAMLRARGGPLAVVCNYESAWRDPFAAWALSIQWDAVVCDEGHILSNPNSATSKFTAKLHHCAKRRYVLTGTPYTQTPLSVFGQMKFLDPGIFGTSKTQFDSRYAVRKRDELQVKIDAANKLIIELQRQVPPDMDLIQGEKQRKAGLEKVMLSIPPGWITGMKNEAEFTAKCGLLLFRRKCADVQDLPTLTLDDRAVSLGPKTIAAYNAMEEEFIAELGEDETSEKVCSASTALVKLLRLGQVCSGFLPVDETKELIRLGTEKEDALFDLLSETEGEKWVVFTRFAPDADSVQRVAERMKLRYREMSGRRKDAIGGDGELVDDGDIFCLQYQSGGVGIGCAKARYVCFFSPSLSLVQHDQAIKRLHRGGQERPVFAYFLVASGTVDQRIYKALAEKREVINEILAGLSKRQA